MKLALALLLVTAAAVAPAAGVVEPPVPVRTPLLLVPPETAGSGLTPEVAVRVAIDEQGVVRRVEVLSISPPSEHDDSFRRAVVETLSRWRYAPQRRDGRPEPATLEWHIRFPARSARAPVDPEALPRAAPVPTGDDAESRRSAILALPERKRLALLEGELAAALARLDPGRRRRAESDHVVAYSDADDSRVAETVARNVEAVFHVLATELFPEIALERERYKLQVVAYRDQASYAALIAELPMFEWSAGFYSPAGLIAFHLEQASNDAATGVLLHEATHAFLDRFVVRRGVALPRWLGEGFADYVGNSAIRKGRLEPGRTLRHKYELQRHRVASVRPSGAQRVEQARRALRAGSGLGLGDLLGAAPETFYGERHELYYASAWLLVHFLRDGGDGWARERFPRALLYLAEGYPAAEVVAELYGPLRDNEQAFRRYVEKF